jgi:hypothetical protein
MIGIFSSSTPQQLKKKTNKNTNTHLCFNVIVRRLTMDLYNDSLFLVPVIFYTLIPQFIYLLIWSFKVAFLWDWSL